MKQERRSAYQRFVEASAVRDDGYLFDTPRCRFQPEPSDEIVLLPGTTVVAEPGGAKVLVRGGASLSFPGFSAEVLGAALQALPTSFASFSVKLGPQAPAFIEQAFSRILFAPSALLELERQVPSLELVRFPGSPYEVVRPYWRNMIGVRRIVDERPTPASGQALMALLLELHVLLLTGEPQNSGRDSFYLPASVLGRKRVTPGELYEAPTGLEHRDGEWILTSGARVSVPLLGGEHYWRLLAESVSDAAALDPERHLQCEGIDFGRVLIARALQDARPGPWFLPPRPLLPAHFEGLWLDLQRAVLARSQGNVDEALEALGAFHYRFVRLHPLPSANQSLAMCFVNAELARLLGVGIPHLLLDQLALRFERAAYCQLFARAARAWNVPLRNSADRLRQLMTMRSLLNEFVTALGQAPSLLQARALVALPERAEACALALLSPSTASAPQSPFR